jgi:hypothetical protein
MATRRRTSEALAESGRQQILAVLLACIATASGLLILVFS